MRLLTAIVHLSLILLLSSCEHSDIAPELGRDCFERQRATLPPGTQYEGIDQVAEGRFTIKIMNGVAVTTLDCVLNPDGTLQDVAK